MKRFLIFFFSLFLIAFNSAYAVETPSELRVLEVSDTSISLDWADVTDAIGYYMYYGTTSGSGGVYETEGIDLIDNNEFTITDLSPETNYFIAVTSVDEFGTESAFSPELQQATLLAGAKAQATSFRIKSVDVLGKDSLSFEFSADLENSPSAVREFIVAEKNSSIELGVDISDIDPTNPKGVIVVLSSELSPVTEYKVTVLDIRDTGGNTIESWVDAFISFMTPAVIEEQTQPETPAEPETQTWTTQEEETETPAVEEEEIPLNSAGNEEELAAETNDGNAGVNLSKEDIGDNTTMTATENDTLPQTGPEHVLLILMALLISGTIYIIGTRKHS